MWEKTRGLFFDSNISIYTVEYICGDNWWIDDTGQNWWNRKTFFPYNAVYLTKVGCFDLKINGSWYHVTPNRVVFIPAGSKLEFSFDGNGPLEKYFVHFDLNYSVGSFAECFDVPCLFEPKDEARIEALFRELIALSRADRDPAASVAACGAMTSLVAQVLAQGGAKFNRARDFLAKEMREAIESIEKRYCEPISIAELAQKAGYSVTYFTKKFKSTFGCTPTEYIMNLKIEQAKYLLKSNEMSVSDISSALGFTENSHFSSFFKQKTGLSPTYYRKRAPTERLEKDVDPNKTD